jgi:methyl-accepting chemotaxis protein
VQNLELISESAGNVDAMVTEISNSSHDQATGIDQMTNALSEMEIVVQDTASISEESASSAIELERQAKDMQEIMELLVTMVGDESLLSKDEGNIGFKKTKPAKKAKFPEMSPNMSAGYENDFSLDYDEDEPELITDYS